MNKQFRKRKGIVNEKIKSCSISLIKREIQIETIVKYYLTLFRLAKIKIIDTFYN